MSTGTIPIIMCDDEWCDASETDHYEMGATSVGGVRVTRSRPAPGWYRDGDFDYCDRHSAACGGEQGE